jgi:hypothetical protein
MTQQGLATGQVELQVRQALAGASMSMQLPEEVGPQQL